MPLPSDWVIPKSKGCISITGVVAKKWVIAVWVLELSKLGFKSLFH
jgi:hypothetical protein